MPDFLLFLNVLFASENPAEVVKCLELDSYLLHVLCFVQASPPQIIYLELERPLVFLVADGQELIMVKIPFPPPWKWRITLCGNDHLGDTPSSTEQ